jgi:hypothetical protein
VGVRFMTHPPTLCASCMGQVEIVWRLLRVVMLAEVSERGWTLVSEPLARPLPIWGAAGCSNAQENGWAQNLTLGPVGTSQKGG